MTTRGHVGEEDRRFRLILATVVTVFVAAGYVIPYLPLPEVEMIPATGSAKRWRQQTPAMAVGLIAHIWSLREGRMYRVPPWPQNQVSEGACPVEKGQQQR